MDYKDFLEEVRKTRRESTYKTYFMALKLFPEGTEDEILDYIDKNPHKSTTKKYNLRVLKMALEYNNALTRGMARIIKTYKADETVQECPTVEQVGKVWDNLPSARERAIFALMAFMGLRVGEVRNLNLSDIKDGRIILRKTKGHRGDIVPMVHRAIEPAINAYLKERRPTDSEALFTSTRGRISVDWLKHLIKNEFNDNGFPQFHCHSLRRFYANAMYRAGVSLVDMQDNMRHKSVETTRRYLNLGQQNKIAAMQQTWGNDAAGRFTA